MKMHYQKWSNNIGVKFLILLCVTMISRPPLLLATSHTASDAGANLGNWTLERLGSTDGIKNRSSNPLTNNSTPLNSLNDASSFNAQLSCPSTSSFLTVTTSSVAITNDLGPSTIEVDTDLDGTIDYTYTPPFHISGVCANGVISCDPGTWTTCNYYRWQSNPSLNVTLNPVLMTDLGGCYCVNASCGSPSTTILPKILEDLGTGAAAAIQAIDPKFSISNVTNLGSSIEYYGQNTANCSSVPSSSGTNNPEQYFGNAGAMATDTTNEVSVQSSDPDSYYNLMTGSLASSTAASAFPTCAVERVITVTTTSSAISNTMTASLCSDHFVFIRAHQVNPITYHLQYLDASPGTAPHWNCEAVGTAGGIGDWHTLKVVNLPSPPTSFQYCLNATSGCTPEASACVNTAGTQVNVMTCHGAGAATASYTMNYLFNYLVDNISETINDSCTGLDINPNCQLKGETIDSVITYANYNPTSLSPLSSCQTFTGGLGSYVECKAWWRKDRTYRCATNTPYDFSDAQIRADAATSNVVANPSRFYYEDLQKDGGTWVSSNSTFSLPSTPSAGTCEMSCKTSKAAIDTDASLSGNTSQFRTSTNTVDVFYKTCPRVSGTPSCPLDPGETLIANCQCQDDFAEAASMMEVLKSAGEEMICEGTTDPNTGQCIGQIRIFNGNGASCRPPGSDTGLFNCCSNGSSSIVNFLKNCDASERALNDARDNGQTHFVGSQCTRSVPLLGCVQQENVYCAFSGKLSRIIHEQGRPQINTYAPSGNWGSAGTPNCGGFTPEDFQMIDFGQIDLSDYFGDITTRTQTQMENDMGTKINHFYNNLQ